MYIGVKIFQCIIERLLHFPLVISCSVPILVYLKGKTDKNFTVFWEDIYNNYTKFIIIIYLSKDINLSILVGNLETKCENSILNML